MSVVHSNSDAGSPFFSHTHIHTGLPQLVSFLAVDRCAVSHHYRASPSVFVSRSFSRHLVTRTLSGSPCPSGLQRSQLQTGRYCRRRRRLARRSLLAFLRHRRPEQSPQTATLSSPLLQPMLAPSQSSVAVLSLRAVASGGLQSTSYLVRGPRSCSSQGATP